MKTGFGWVEVGGRVHHHDVIIHTDGTVTKRKKQASKGLKVKFGHTPLSGAELEFLGEEHPTAVYIGTGQYGTLPLTMDAKEVLERYRAVVAPTPELLPLLMEEKERSVAVLHVTC
ncbi:MAG: hypothetical protein NT074_02665 [Methanomicrobiales archaeon]|jgi:hypothetical protein|nr:hypothetical protein [Methanomicrobiales archaeon]